MLEISAWRCQPTSLIINQRRAHTLHESQDVSRVVFTGARLRNRELDRAKRLPDRKLDDIRVVGRDLFRIGPDLDIEG